MFVGVGVRIRPYGTSTLPFSQRQWQLIVDQWQTIANTWN
jgi:hypothetical protein